MLKRLDLPSGYHPAHRSASWIKLKSDYLTSMHDSLDLVPIGAWHGQGRKTAWLSPWLLAVYNTSTGEYESLCRCMSGFTDEFYIAATQRFLSEGYVCATKKSYYKTGERASVWFEPREVWEVRGAELTLSPVHLAGRDDLGGGRGLGLRFPRFIGVREDKGVEGGSSS